MMLFGVRHENRLGRFKVSREFLSRWKDCLWMFGNFVIVDVVNRSWGENVVEYVAFSELFEVASENCIPPEYNIEVSTEEGFPKIKAVKI